MFSVSSYYSFLHSLIFLFMILVFLFCYFTDFLIFTLYPSSLCLHLLFGALLLYKNLDYLLIAFSNSYIAEFYIIKLYTCIIYIYSFLYIKPIFCIKIRTSFLYSLALSLSLSLTTAMVLAVSFLSISRYPPIFLKFLFILHQHLIFDKYIFNFFIFYFFLTQKRPNKIYVYLKTYHSIA